jgi:hypothetical protein
MGRCDGKRRRSNITFHSVLNRILIENDRSREVKGRKR